jgi:hypothetical protein
MLLTTATFWQDLKSYEASCMNTLHTLTVHVPIPKRNISRVIYIRKQEQHTQLGANDP